MFGLHIEKYEQPVGPWAQRAAGLVLLVSVSLTTALAVLSLAGRSERFDLGSPWFGLALLATCPWFAAVSIRLLLARMTGRDLLPPVMLIVCGTALVFGTAWFGSDLQHTPVPTNNGRGIAGGLLTGVIAIVVGFARRRSRSRP